jgi:glycosyltransferase involved in cell wall biosynthesis
LRIVIVITSLGIGGAERLVTSLADRFVAKGHEVVLVSLTGRPEMLPKDPRVCVEVLDMTRTVRGVATGMGRLRKLLMKVRPDVVNSHLVHANILLRLLRPFVRMQNLISSAHNTNEEGRWRMIAYRLTDRMADISTNVSMEAVQTFLEQKALRPGRMVAMYNGIDTGLFRFSAECREKIRAELQVKCDTPLLVSVGRLSEPKDYPNLLKAFCAVVEEHAAAHLAIVGEGPLHDALVAMADELGISGRVNFLGVRNDIPALLSSCDLFVLPSAWEGFGLAVAEAMACERIVVATNCGGVREVVGDVGFLVRPRDSVALADEARYALSLDDEQRRRLASAGRARIEKLFSLDTAVEKWLQLFRGEIPMQ